MLDPIRQFLGEVLAVIYAVVPNLGLAIIILTILINLLLFPLTLKQTRSMRAMTEIQPEVKRLQKEYKDDRQQLNEELMALYKERGVNPAAGCLPILLQFPIWISLFGLLRDPLNNVPADSKLAEAIEAGRTTFLGMELGTSPSQALSDGFVGAIPYLLIVIFVVATGYWQQRQTTARRSQSGEELSGPAQQTQAIMKFMPLIFGFFSYTLPAGVDVYFATSQVFRIGQQAAIIRLDEGRAEEAAAAPAEPRPETGPEPDGDGEAPDQPQARQKGSQARTPPPKGQAPEQKRPQQGSKKKKRRRRR